MAQKTPKTTAEKTSATSPAKPAAKSAAVPVVKPAVKKAAKSAVKPAAKTSDKASTKGAAKAKAAKVAAAPEAQPAAVKAAKPKAPKAKATVARKAKGDAAPAAATPPPPAAAIEAPSAAPASEPAPVRRTFVKPNWQRRTGSVVTADTLGTLGALAAATPPVAGRPPHLQPAFPASAPPAKPVAPAPVPTPRPAAAPPPAPRPVPAPAPARPPAPPAPPEVLEYFTGILEFGRKEKSEGRLRQLDGTYIADALDPVVGIHQIEKYNLRPGLKIKVSLGKPFGGGPAPHAGHYGKKHKGGGGRDALRIDPMARRVRDILEVEGLPPETWANGRNFDKLTIVMPEPRLSLEYPGCPPACRFIDLFCPVGKGTRGMIVSPPKAGKTTLLQQIATAIHHNHPQIEVFALLIDERPEEVTDFRRNVPVTVWASSNDHPPEKHVGLAIAAIERCKRLAEMGKDVVVLLDSLTRLGRAFNVAPNIIGTGKTLSGGLDAGALGVPKQLFGAARRFEEGGSLTIIATALVDTGSRGDQVIFEEFKGTGNMELILDRRIAEQRLFPAMDLAASGTRNDQKLMTPHELETVTALRRRLLSMPPPQQMDQLLKAVARYKTNAELVGDPNSVAKA